MYQRYAAYFTATGPLAATGAAWLGWDIAAGQSIAHPQGTDIDVEAITQTPRRYGFHGTIKAPFFLASGRSQADLTDAFVSLCGRLQPVLIEQLQVVALGRFLALVPVGDDTALRQMAAQVVQDLDAFRAPITDQELARRRKANLSPAQAAHLLRWGYPHVMDQFRFHMTLTGKLPRAQVDQVMQKVAGHFANVLPKPFGLDALTLAGERSDGHWQSLHRVPFAAPPL